MDDQKQQSGKKDDGTHDIPLAAGVDIVPDVQEIDDVEIESYNDDLLTGELSVEDRLKRLKEKLRECNRERKEYLNGWQRVKADYINFKKREAEEKSEFMKFAHGGMIADLLPVLESFHMAFANKEAWGKVDSGWRKGVEHIHTQLLQALQTHGLTEVNPIGEVFNPSEHTAIGTIETKDQGQYHKIAEVVQLGYRLHGKLIKTPAVKIFGEVSSDAPPS